MIKILDSLPFGNLISNAPICKCGCNCMGYHADIQAVYEKGTFSDGEG